MRSRDYESAIYYYEKGLRFDPENADAYYAMGICYHSMAYEARDADLSEQAKVNYERALEIDPDHQEAKGELEKLHKMMDQF
jgi:tetratricopeptide (TPR) repeat protein